MTPPNPFDDPGATLPPESGVIRRADGVLAWQDSPANPILSTEAPAVVVAEAAGRYRLGPDAEIGRGGFGRVLVAFDAAVGRDVAIKELLDDDGDAAARFLREARVTGQLEHPNIVPVYEIGQRSDGRPYYTMKLVRGRTLSKALREARTLGDRLRLLHHVVDLCHAVAYAHSRGVVHRDLKTDNVMLGEFGETVVLDWGLAKARGQQDLRGGELRRELKLMHDAATGATVEGMVVGTPAYMSPEQANGDLDAIDERSDVWSLGAVLYEVLAGHPPFTGRSVFDVIMKVLEQDVVPPRDVDAAIPPELSAVAVKALQRAKEARYQQARELADEVGAYMAGGRIKAYAYSPWEVLRGIVARNRLASCLAGLLILVLAVGSVVLYGAWRQAGEERDRATASERLAQERLVRSHLVRVDRLLVDRNHAGAWQVAREARDAWRASGAPADLAAPVESALFEARVRQGLEVERAVPSLDAELTPMDWLADGATLAALAAGGTPHLISALDPGQDRRGTAGLGLQRLWPAPDDGPILAGAASGVLVELEPTDLSPRRTEPLADGPVVSWALSPDRQRVLFEDGDGMVWLQLRGRPAAALPVGLVVPGRPATFAFSPDGERLARATPAGAVALHDGHGGGEISQIRAGDTAASVLAFSPDGGRLAVRSRRSEVLLDLVDGRRLARLDDRQIALFGLQFSPDGEALAIAGHKTVRLWDGRSDEPHEVLWEGATGGPARWSRSGGRLATWSDGVLRLWRVRTEGRASRVPSVGIPVAVHACANGERVVFGCSTGRVYRVERGQPGVAHPVTTHDALVSGVACSPDGTRLASIDDAGELKILDLLEGRELFAGPVAPATGPRVEFPSVAFSPEGRWLVATGPPDGPVLFDARTLERVRDLSGVLGGAKSLAFSPDGTRLVAGGQGGAVAGWETSGWQPIARWAAGADLASDVAVTADGTGLFVAGKDGHVRRLDLSSGTVLAEIRAHGAWINRLALAPAGDLLVTASDDQSVKTWDARTLTLVRTHPTDTQAAAVAFTPDGAWLAVGEADALILYPQPAGRLIDDAPLADPI